MKWNCGVALLAVAPAMLYLPVRADECGQCVMPAQNNCCGADSCGCIAGCGGDCDESPLRALLGNCGCQAYGGCCGKGKLSVCLRPATAALRTSSAQ